LKGILLFGPPGTGKTLLAKAVANECKSTFFSVSSSSLTSKNFGDSEKLIRGLFSAARKNEPAVIFLDEADSLLCKRGGDTNEVNKRIKTEFLVQLDGVGEHEENVLFMVATNRPEQLDDAIQRRLPMKIYVALPGLENRINMLINLKKK